MFVAGHEKPVSREKGGIESMKKLIALILAILMCLTASFAMADAWKSGDTVYFHVNAKAGGATDLYTRYLTQALTEVCPGVNFVVQNYETAEVALATVQGQKPDGLNLGTLHSGAFIQWFTGASNISVKDDLKVVGVMNFGGPQAIIAGPNAPYKNLAELADWIKANPGKLMVGCSLGGTSQMIFINIMKGLVGDSDLVTYVQCASEADKLTMTASNSIDLANCSIPNAVDYEADGKLTILGTFAATGVTLDDIKELTGKDLSDNYKTGPDQGYESATWNGNHYVYVPKDTPDEICEAINEALCKANDVASYIEGNKAMASFIGAVNYAEATAAFESEWATMEELVTQLGLKMEGR